jgi:hypothetical protein
MKRHRAYHQLHPEYDSLKQIGGISPRDETTTGFAKIRGQLIHGCLDVAIRGGDWQTWLSKQPAMLPEPFGTLEPEAQKLWSALIRRVVKGWLDVRWSQLKQDYEPMSAEEEWIWALSPLVAQSLRMDQIWRRRSDGALLIVDFKTLGSPDINWIDRLRNSDQTHLYVQALVERTQEPVMGIQYEGLMIGRKNAKDGRWQSPFVSGYLKNDRVSFKWVAGSGPYSTLHWSDEEVFQAMGPGLLNEQYCTTGPLYPPPSQLLQTKEATVQAEIKWADIQSQLRECADQFGQDSQEYQSMLERLVERQPDACLKYGMGYACSYMPLCWDGQAPDSESFEPRIDHHESEN